MKNKFVKIENPHYPEYSKIDYILDPKWKSLEEFFIPFEEYKIAVSKDKNNKSKMKVLQREQFSYQEQYDNAVYTAELLAETYNLKGLNELLEKDSKNVIYKHALYLKTKANKWWNDKSNFPCMLIANLDGGDALVWVHYQIDGIAYDVRDFGYLLTGSTNWRRATIEEILDNVKGL